MSADGKRVPARQALRHLSPTRAVCVPWVAPACDSGCGGDAGAPFSGPRPVQTDELTVVCRQTGVACGALALLPKGVTPGAARRPRVRTSVWRSTCVRVTPCPAARHTPRRSAGKAVGSAEKSSGCLRCNAAERGQFGRNYSGPRHMGAPFSWALWVAPHTQPQNATPARFAVFL